MTLSEKIAECVERKIGNKEFVLTGYPNSWVAAIGNTSAHVGIGEMIGYGDDSVDLLVEGDTPDEVVDALLAILVKS